MFDSFLFCVLFCVVMAGVNLLVQWAIVGRDVMGPCCLLTPSFLLMLRQFPYATIAVFLLNMCMSGLLIWLLPVLAWGYVFTIPFSCYVLHRAARRIRLLNSMIKDSMIKG